MIKTGCVDHDFEIGLIPALFHMHLGGRVIEIRATPNGWIAATINMEMRIKDGEWKQWYFTPQFFKTPDEAGRAAKAAPLPDDWISINDMQGGHYRG